MSDTKSVVNDRILELLPIYPSIPALVKISGLYEAGVRYRIKKLLQAGLIEVQKEDHGKEPKLYRVKPTPRSEHE